MIEALLKGILMMTSKRAPSGDLMKTLHSLVEENKQHCRSLFLVMIAATATIVWIATHKICRRLKNEPPGPVPLPVVGNLFGFLRNAHVNLKKLKDRYGSVVKLKLGSRSLVFVSSVDAMRRAMESRNFDDRADSYIGDLVSCDGNDLVFAKYGERWKLHRQLITRGMASVVGGKMSNLEKVVIEESHDMVKRILNCVHSPFDPENDISLAVLNTMCFITFGTRYAEGDPEFNASMSYIRTIAESFDSIGKVIDCFPILKLFPFEKLKNLDKAIKIRDRIMESQLEKHRSNECEMQDLTNFLMNKKQTSNKHSVLLNDIHLKLLMFDMFGAGVETTIAAIRWTIVYLIRWPDCQKKVQAEIDKLKPENSHITIDDMKNCHYTQAVVCESLRMCSLFPMAPRKAVKDSTICGYSVPKGTNVIFSLWEINHDEDHWENPHVFAPERFIGIDGRLQSLRHLSFAPFSIGGRSCPGERIARNEIFLIICTILQNFEIQPSNELPSLNSIETVSSKPMAYQCVFIPRKAINNKL